MEEEGERGEGERARDRAGEMGRGPDALVEEEEAATADCLSSACGFTVGGENVCVRERGGERGGEANVGEEEDATSSTDSGR